MFGLSGVLRRRRLSARRGITIHAGKCFYRSLLGRSGGSVRHDVPDGMISSFFVSIVLCSRQSQAVEPFAVCQTTQINGDVSVLDHVDINPGGKTNKQKPHARHSVQRSRCWLFGDVARVFAVENPRPSLGSDHPKSTTCSASISTRLSASFFQGLKRQLILDSNDTIYIRGNCCYDSFFDD